jgi:uncharacterized protein (TIRG00374 family)
LKRHYLIKSIGLIVLIAIVASVDLGDVVDQIGKSDYRYLIAVIALIFPQVALRALRWQRLMAQQGIDCPIRLALVFYFAAIYIGLITPGRMGEVGKCFFLKQNGIAGVAQSLPSVVLDRLLDLYVLGLIALGALYFMPLRPLASWILALLAILAAGSPWLLFKGVRAGGRWGGAIDAWLLRIGPRWRETWHTFAHGSLSLITPRLIEALALTLLSYLLYFTQVCLIGQAIDLPLGCGPIAMVTAVAILVGYVPITIAGLGTREATLLLLFGQYGIPAASVLSFAFWYNLVYIVCVGLISAFFWLRVPHRRTVKRRLKDTR